MPYQLSRDGQLYGPYTLEDLQRYIVTQNVLPTDMVKSEDDADWVTVAALLESRGAPVPTPIQTTEYSVPGFGVAPAWQTEAAVAVAPEFQRYPFFPVSVVKFVVLSVATFGLYHMYWAYKQWVRITADSHENLMPWARALFLGIWNFPLFGEVDTRASNDGIPTNWNYIALGFGALVLGGISRLPHGWGIISLLSFIPYMPVVATIEQINAKLAPVTAEGLNRNFSVVNIVGAILGGILALLAVVGSISEATKYANSR